MCNCGGLPNANARQIPKPNTMTVSSQGVLIPPIVPSTQATVQQPPSPQLRPQREAVNQIKKHFFLGTQ